MSHEESRHRHRERERGRPPVSPRSRSTTGYTAYRPFSRRHSTMDYDDPMPDRAPRHDIPPTDSISGDPRGQEAILLDLHAMVTQDMVGIQDRIKYLIQKVEEIPAQVTAGMVKPGAAGDQDRQSWWQGVTNWYQSQQSYEQGQAPPPHININETRVVELQGEKKVLSDQNSALQRELDAAKWELDVAQRKAAGMEGQLRENQKEVNKLRNKEAMFRNMILDQAGVQKISDDDIRDRHLKLRQDIQKLSRSPSYSVDSNPIMSTPPSPQQEEFYRASVWGLLGVGDRRLRMRARIFTELHVYILGYNCFGLHGIERDGGALPGPLEPGLRRFEDFLGEQGVSDSVISDWRISTINCIELAGIEETTSAVAAASISSILAPLLSKYARTSEEEALRSNIVELCKDAFKLKMMMRKSKDTYLVERIGPEVGLPLSALEDMADPVSVEGGKSSESSDDILYTVFGALTKQPQGKDQPVKVLEKAQVVLKKR